MNVKMIPANISGYFTKHLSTHELFRYQTLTANCRGIVPPLLIPNGVQTYTVQAYHILTACYYQHQQLINYRGNYHISCYTGIIEGRWNNFKVIDALKIHLLDEVYIFSWQHAFVKHAKTNYPTELFATLLSFDKSHAWKYRCRTGKND